jgi:hypothetical protein
MIPQTAVYPKGGSVMEPRKIETPAQPRGEGQTAPPRQPQQKRRFRIVKLEERIAPKLNNTKKPCGGGGSECCGPKTFS